MDYSKHIVVDFDDTLAFVENYDFENAKINVALIDRLNEYVANGWTVDVYTARGHLSCSSRKEAEEKYRNKIEALLNNLNYRVLSFDKPFAALYIDDKAITPQEFLK